MFETDFNPRTVLNPVFNRAFSPRLRPQITDVVGTADFARHEVVDHIAAPIAAEVLDVNTMLELS